MICPFCDTDNIPGADNCEACEHDLTAWDVSRGGEDVSSNVSCAPISAVKSPSVITVTPTATVSEVVDRLVSGNIGCVLVMTNGDLVGIFSERDLLMRVADRYDELKNSPVRDFMTKSPETLPPDATVAWALNRMDVGGFRHIPIIRDGRPVGVVSVRDLVGFLYDHYASARGG